MSGEVDLVSVWGAVLATGLAGIKFWETFFRDRRRFDTSFSFTSLADDIDSITIVNVTGQPVQVSSWTLCWRRRWPIFWIKSVDVTPDFDPQDDRSFKIDPHSKHVLWFEQQERFDGDIGLLMAGVSS